MTPSLSIGLLTVALAGVLSGCGGTLSEATPVAGAPDMVTVAAGQLQHRLPGEFLSGNTLVVSPMADTQVDQSFLIMRRQVSQAEYAQCVQEQGCRPLDKEHRRLNAPDLPVVGVSWNDASAYATWLSGKTGQSYRLPTYVEWAHAAGTSFQDIDVIAIQDAANPALRWLEEYRRETTRQALPDTQPQRFGAFGTASTGLQDVGGNVWDWTDTCYTRSQVGPDGRSAVELAQHCGIRVLAGRHIAYIPDFIRDPSSGACSVGIPPANLGFRLVRQDQGAAAKGAAGRLRELLRIAS